MIILKRTHTYILTSVHARRHVRPNLSTESADRMCATECATDMRRPNPPICATDMREPAYFFDFFDAGPSSFAAIFAAFAVAFASSAALRCSCFSFRSFIVCTSSCSS